MSSKYSPKSHKSGSNVYRTGLVASGKYTQALKAARDAAPDYAMNAQKGMQAKSNVRQAEIKAKALEERAKIESEAQITAAETKGAAQQSRFQAAYDANDMLAEAQSDLKQTKRKAGMLASLGAIAFAGTRALTRTKKPAPTPRPEIDTSGIDAAVQNYREVSSQFPTFDDLDTAGTTSTSSESSGASAATAQTAAKGKTAPASITPLNMSDNQKFALNSIASVESGKWGYDAVNQMGLAGGHEAVGSGAFSDMTQHGGRKLSTLPVGEVMELQAPRPGMSNEEWIRQGRIHAAGRYQFIGSTLRGIVDELGIDPSTPFSPELQDRMALHLGRQNVNNLSNTWIGLKNLSPAELARVKAGLS